MPITLKKIANNIAQVSFQYGEETVTLIYYPSRITEKTFKQLQSFEAMDQGSIEAGFESLNEILCSLIKSWDVFEDDAELLMFPLKTERLSELPIPFRLLVLQTVMGDMRPEALSPQRS